MSSYHFYEGKKNDMNEIVDILYEFEKEIPTLGYPKVDLDKLKTRILYFMQHGKILLVKNLDENKLIGIAVIHQTEYLWSKELLLNIQTMYVLKNYRSFELFNKMMKIIKTKTQLKMRSFKCQMI